MNFYATRFMSGDWFLVVLFFVYPLIVIAFNRYIRSCISCKETRRCFLQENDYVNKLLYLLMPLLVLHLELLMLHAGYPFYEINRWVIIIMVVLQVYLFGTAVFSFFQLFKTAKKLSQYLSEK